MKHKPISSSSSVDADETLTNESLEKSLQDLLTTVNKKQKLTPLMQQIDHFSKERVEFYNRNSIQFKSTYENIKHLSQEIALQITSLSQKSRLVETQFNTIQDLYTQYDTAIVEFNENEREDEEIKVKLYEFYQNEQSVCGGIVEDMNQLISNQISRLM